MWGWRSSRTVVLALAVTAFVVACVLPVWSVLRTAVGGLPEALALDSRRWALLMNTCALGVGTALVAAAVGVPLGVSLARAALPYRGALRLALAAPAVLPPYLVALAWTYVTGRQSLLASLLDPSQVAAWTYSLPAAIVVLAVGGYPLVMLATEVALRRVDGRLEEAGLMVTHAERVVRRITLPLVAPSVVASGLIVFVLAISEFGVPGVLRVRVYTTEVFTAFAALYDPARAAQTALPLLLLCGGVAAMAVVLLGDRLVSAQRATPTPHALLAARAHRVEIAIALVVAGALVFPLAILGREAMRSRSVTAALAGSGAAIVNSLWVAGASASITVGVAMWLGYARSRVAGIFGMTIDVALVALFAVPSTLVGVGLIATWNRPGPAGTIYGTDGMPVLASVARWLPVATLILAAVVRTVPRSHEEAGAVSGSAWLRSLWHLVLPQTRTGLVAVWITVFVFAFGELGATILVAPPGETTLPIRIYTLIANAPASTVAALALLQATVILTPLAVVAGWLARQETP